MFRLDQCENCGEFRINQDKTQFFCCKECEEEYKLYVGQND